jgi:hypothetical protein
MYLKKPTYCYWIVDNSFCDSRMAEMVTAARNRGVNTDIIAFSPREIEGADTYDLYDIDHADPLFPLVYLQAGLLNLSYDVVIYIDRTTEIRGEIVNTEALLNFDPLHVPLSSNHRSPNDVVLERTARRFGFNRPWRSNLDGGFVLRRRAVERVVELCGAFRKFSGEQANFKCSELVGSVCQILSGDTRAHEVQLTRQCWDIQLASEIDSNAALITKI